MERCEAPGFPDCFHECEKDKCIAFYSVDEHYCYRGCGSIALSVAFVSAIERRGWATRTSCEAKGIPTTDVAAMLTALMMLPVTEPPSVDRVKAMGVMMSIGQRLARQPDDTIEFRWHACTVVEALRSLEDHVSAMPA